MWITLCEFQFSHVNLVENFKIYQQEYIHPKPQISQAFDTVINLSTAITVNTTESFIWWYVFETPT
ncbi:hypothetical protein Calkro_0002 [Caldicellulosiruptor kronotskyensis 2002]|uniref:Uncharacterized protein n=3 Tax=Caldicellulosiruptor TaxID=44000 RepID=E4SBZ8_CALK2|nr:hypothetical protein Calkro_0002 [Caldicellulosiruptor kronotskyensis 2002]